MRKSFVALALLFGAVALMTNLAFAQTDADPANKLVNAKMSKELLSRAARLGTNAPTGVDTTYVGHTIGAPNSGPPWYIGAGAYAPGVSTRANWDWDHFNVGENDSLQGWWPFRRAYNLTGGLTLADNVRPWWALDFGNQVNYKLNSLAQARTTGVNGVWHVDGLNTVAGTALNKPTWAPIAGAASAWCGLRGPDDLSVKDDVAQGGYGNWFNSNTMDMNGGASARVQGLSRNFPGYASQWDQMLYRDVRVANGASLTVGFSYKTKLSKDIDTAPATRTGWFDKDPRSLASGNFISSTAAAASAPADSFMVYVGVPANPTNLKLSDNTTATIQDLKRRWFSEVIAVDAPYKEIMTVSDSTATVQTPAPFVVANAVLQPMLDHARNGGTGDGGGVIRVVFRVKTNRGFDDEGTTYSSQGRGAVVLDNVSITGGASAISSGFDTASEISNVIEAPNSASPGPAVGQGYALNTWHSTGKPPAIFFHTHPIAGGDIGGGNFYTPLNYADLCGAYNASSRLCNIDGVVISVGLHDLGERPGGQFGTAEQEVLGGINSPTINMAPTSFTIPTGDGRFVNGMGLDADDVDVTDDIYVWYDLYAGIYNLNFTGNAWWFAFQSYPCIAPNGSTGWGEIRVPTFQIFNPEPQCFTDWEPGYYYGLIRTTAANNIPDSLRVSLGNNQQCFRFAVSLGCSPNGGAYFDNVSLAFVDAGPPLATNSAAAVGNASVDIWQWYNDAFPFNETPGLPGTAAFDTTTILTQTGINLAQSTGSATRFDIPGDSTRITASGAGVRVDLVFRILPGPGNYVTAGVKSSGVRKVATAAVAATPNDGSFWGEYMGSNDGGSGFGTPGGHGAAWNELVWNSARCDTAETNIFPVNGNTNNLPGLTDGVYASMYHDSDPKFATLGIVKNRCFLVDTLGPANTTNITCNSVPVWATVVPGSRTGYDGLFSTKEYTKILPSGLLTPGSHVQYFFRKSLLSDPATFFMVPDTNFITPQSGEGPSSDGHRWQQFGALPDRWKSTSYGGLGDACMLYVDFNDRRGNERVWVSTADTIGATAATKYGAHNGWHVDATYLSSDGSHDYTGDNIFTVPGPTAAVSNRNAQPGTTWDMYGVKASESLSTQAGALGSRLANRVAMGYATGKQSMQGPTPEMLRTYYKIMMILSGDLNSGILGPFVNRSQNDVQLITDFMSFGAVQATPRGVFIQGDGFAQSETQTGGVDPAHSTLLSTFLATTLRDGSYQGVSGNTDNVADLIPTAVISPRGDVFGVQNSCLFSNDLLSVNTAVSGATVASYYQNVGPNGPYVASVYAPSTSGHPYITLLDGWEIEHLRSRFDESNFGRLVYFIDVFSNVFGGICAVNGTPSVDVPNNTTGPRLVNFVGNVRNNPLSAGQAAVSFGLARKDRVEINVFDVTGRKVKTLANRDFQAGEHTLTWDGTNDQGQVVSRGVYFTQVKFVNSRFVDAKKVTVLK